MNLHELFTKIISKEITIDENGHNPFYGWGEEKLIENIKERLNYVRHEIFDANKLIPDIDKDSPCPKCGVRFGWMYIPSENKILCVQNILHSEGKMSNWYHTYDNKRCPLEKRPARKIEFKVNDAIIFSNFFLYQMNLSEKYEDEKRYGYHDINTYQGRNNLSDFFESINCGYQQLGNTSIELYINETKDELLVMEETLIYRESTSNDEDEEIEFYAKYELPKFGYKKVGYISCSMWRYMFINESDLAKDAKDEKGNPLEWKEQVKVKLVKGTYEVENFYDSNEWNDHKIAGFNIASRIKLKA